MVLAVRKMIGTSVALTNIFGEREAVFSGHHYIENTQVESSFPEGFEASHPVGSQCDIVVVHFEIGAKNITKILVVSPPAGSCSLRLP
jgi:hypothetical protein